MADWDKAGAMIALSGIKRVGPTRIRKIIKAGINPADVFDMDASELKKVGVADKSVAGFMAAFDGWDDINRILENVDRIGARVVCLGDDDFPELLADIPHCPAILYVRGTLHAREQSAAAVIGCRTPTNYGKKVANRLGFTLAEKGVSVISGMARGIDTAAHKGALEAEGRTIAVLGTGIDIPYPPENADMMEKICADGAVITEFPPGTGPHPPNFPKRNRIVAAMSQAMVVVEAGQKSGALLTAQDAKNLRVPVFAVPGQINAPKSAGTNQLIKEGAGLLSDLSDLEPYLECIPPATDDKPVTIKKPPPRLEGDEALLYDLLSETPEHIDCLAGKSGIPSHKLLNIILPLELAGHVTQLAGKMFVRS